jgi:hypothetical protein
VIVTGYAPRFYWMCGWDDDKFELLRVAIIVCCAFHCQTRLVLRRFLDKVSLYQGYVEDVGQVCI